MRKIVFEVPGKVVGKARPRLSTDGHAYTPVGTRLYEKKIRQAFLAAGGIMLRGPLHVDIEAVYGIQKTATKAQRAKRMSGEEIALMKPDIDNVEKIVYDALCGCCYADDTCIVSTRSIKGRYEAEPRLIVRVREIDPQDVGRMHEFMWGNGNI